MIYLDNAATSFPKPPEVIEAITRALTAPASPGRSGHAPSLAASRLVHKARKNVAKLFGIKDNSRLAFTANITWALNMALEGFGLRPGDHVLSSSLEHNSVARPLARLAAEKGIEWTPVPVDAEGWTDPARFRELVRPETRLVAVNHASNVTGALTDLAAVRAAVGSRPILVDVAQTAGALDLTKITGWADLVAFTGHKGLLGPTGTGGLWVAPAINLRPLAVGGTGSASESLEQPAFLPDALEPGTANTHGLAGLAAGTDFILKTGVDRIREHEMELTEAFLAGLDKIPEVKIWGPRARAKRVSTVAVSVRGWSSSDLAAALEAEAGIMTRAGLQCSPMAHQALGSFQAGGTTRFSFGVFNTLEEVDIAVKTIAKLAALKR